MALAKAFDSKNFESKIYRLWEEADVFKPSDSGKPRTIIMPPPNANGSLHIGHGVFVALEDCLARYLRMKGYSTLWLPGADHAGFETQVVYQKKLEKEGRNFYKIDRDKLYKDITSFTLKNKKLMHSQLKRLGASCDWSRETFTLDERIIKIILNNFKRLYDDGLVYRDNRLVHWCIKHQTTLSDLEIKHIEQKGWLYFIKYGKLTIATTRPETMFSDVAVAVNPTDKRYRKLIGKKILQPLTDRLLPIIQHPLVDKGFGTGALKITPAHDETDFIISKDCHLPLGKVAFGKDGRLSGELVPKKYRGLKAHIARQVIVEDLENKGLLTKQPYTNQLAVCYKCQNPVEPLALPQWYIAMNKPSQKYKKSLRELGIEALEQKKIKFVNRRFGKIYRHWLENLRDWNISRQIVWGIRLPIWYCRNLQVIDKRISNKQITAILQTINKDKRQKQFKTKKCQPIVTNGSKPQKCPICGDKKLVQEKDVFDTWFSSGQWAFAPLQIRSREDFDKFYPTWLMETGHDILFFWVARMVMLGKYFTGKIPFRHIYLHGLVRDKDRQKMSKSKGNVIDPLGIIDQYGADALRMALIFGTRAGNDIVISEEKIRGMRNFTNKLWNIGRFILEKISSSPKTNLPRAKRPEGATFADKEILRLLDETINFTNKNIERFNLHLVAERLYDFTWHKLADKYLEKAKEQLKDPKLAENTRAILVHQLVTVLALLHPFIPFVSESIWQELYKRKLTKHPLLISAPFPKSE